MSLYLGDKLISGSFKSGASWEVGDVGISAFGIDEALNKRRYLNGQVISQAQFVEFTAMLKSRVSVYPNLSTTEVNWQAEVTNSALEQCGKFVIDDVAGTIRLPKVVNIQGLMDLTNLGTTTEAGLPAHKHYLTQKGEDTRSADNLPQYSTKSIASHTSYNNDWSYATGYLDSEADFLASSNPIDNSIYGNSTTVQPESVRYPYFIQVAEGVETSVDVSREIELNNPFSLLDYKYSEYELSNASWLLSNGQWNSGAVYQSVYDLLLQIYNGTVTKAGVSVKLSTEAYADTDFVLNTSDTTFRLPLKVALASGKAVVGNGMTLGLTNGTSFGGLSTDATREFVPYTGVYGKPVGTPVSGSIAFAQQGTGVTTDPLKSGIETSSTGLYLYFYVGETVQDANIIAAASVLTDVADLKNASNFSQAGLSTLSGLGMPSNRYEDLTLGASDTIYTAPANGWFSISKEAGADWYTLYLRVLDENTSAVLLSQTVVGYRSTELKGSLPVRKGQKFQIWYNAYGATNYFRFVYAEGEN